MCFFQLQEAAYFVSDSFQGKCVFLRLTSSYAPCHAKITIYIYIYIIFVKAVSFDCSIQGQKIWRRSKTILAFAV